MRKPKGKAGKPATRVRKSFKTHSRNVLAKRNTLQIPSRRITRTRKGKQQCTAVTNKKHRQNLTSKTKSGKNRIVKTDNHVADTARFQVLDKGEAIVTLNRHIEEPNTGRRRSGRILALIDTNVSATNVLKLFGSFGINCHVFSTHFRYLGSRNVK